VWQCGPFPNWIQGSDSKRHTQHADSQPLWHLFRSIQCTLLAADRRKDVCVTPFYNHAPAQTSKTYTAQALQAAAAVAGQIERQQEVVLPLGNRSTLFFFSGATRDDVTWYRWVEGVSRIGVVISLTCMSILSECLM
jgi:hypothetical protein